jgi:AcrR family transcriptional regulator
MGATSHATTTPAPVATILASARREVERVGIVGLRVAEVAAGANVSLTQIYRYFGDRNGLLARVLGDIFEELLGHSVGHLARAMDALDPVSVEAIIDLLPPYSTVVNGTNQRLRLQILAMSVINDKLAARLQETAVGAMQTLKSALDRVEARLPPGETLDRRLFEILMPLHMPYYNVLLADEGVDDDTMRRYLIDLARGD